MFVHLRVDESLVHCLPVGGVSAEILTYRACVAFEQRGHLGAGLFALLIKERPHRDADIRQVEKAFSAAPVRTQVVDEAYVRKFEETLEHLDRCLEKIKAGENSERAWRYLALLMMGVTAYLIWKHYFNDQDPADIASDPEAQGRLMADAQVASSYGWAYLDVTSYLLAHDSHPADCSAEEIS